MGEFKFSCPACGQHLTGEEDWVGQQIQCPTCHDKLIVPRPSVAMIAKRKTPSPHSTVSLPMLPQRNMTPPLAQPFAKRRNSLIVRRATMAAIAVWLLVLGYIVYNRFPTGKPIPAGPVAGTVGGHSFTCKQADFREGVLSLGENSTTSNEMVTIDLRKSLESAAGKTYVIVPDAVQKTPPIFIRWQDDSRVRSATVMNGYTMRLELDAPDGRNHTTGKLFLELPEVYKTKITGTFDTDSVIF